MPSAPKVIRYRRTARPPERRPNAYQRGYNDRWRRRTAAWIQEQSQQGNCRCAYCKAPLTGKRKDIHVDHRTPPSSAGPVGSDAYNRLHEDEENWVMSCPSCNSAKGNRIALDARCVR